MSDLESRLREQLKLHLAGRKARVYPDNDKVTSDDYLTAIAKDMIDLIPAKFRIELDYYYARDGQTDETIVVKLCGTRGRSLETMNNVSKRVFDELRKNPRFVNNMFISYADDDGIDYLCLRLDVKDYADATDS